MREIRTLACCSLMFLPLVALVFAFVVSLVQLDFDNGLARGPRLQCFRSSGCNPIFLVGTAHHDLERVVRQWSLQRFRLFPRRAHPDVAFLVGGSGSPAWPSDGSARLPRLARLSGSRRLDAARYRLRFGIPVAVERRPYSSERKQRPVVIQRKHTTSFFLVSGLGSGAFSAKLLAGTRQRFSGFSQPRQCGDDVLRMLVTGVRARDAPPRPI